MEFLNSSIRQNSGPKVTPPKTHTKNETTPQEQPTPQNLTEQNHNTSQNQQLFKSG